MESSTSQLALTSSSAKADDPVNTGSCYLQQPSAYTGSPRARGRHSELQTLFAVAAAALRRYAIYNKKPKPEGNAMAIDFEIPPEAKAIREKVRQWVHDECIPAEKELEGKPLKQVLDPLRKKARAQGLWCPFIPKEYGGKIGRA